MKRAFRLAIASACLVGSAGCGDTPEVLIHDCLVFFNELCDYQLRVDDNDKAKEFMDLHFKVLEAKQKNLKERIQTRFLNIDGEGKNEYNDAWYDYYHQKVQTGWRVHYSWNRLDEIVRNTSGPTEHLVKVRDLAKTFIIDLYSAESNPMFGPTKNVSKDDKNMGDGLVHKRFSAKKR